MKSRPGLAGLTISPEQGAEVEQWLRRRDLAPRLRERLEEVISGALFCLRIDAFRRARAVLSRRSDVHFIGGLEGARSRHAATACQ